jgi:glycosyltransferase involved in cell wall biosynthesis
VLVVDDGSTDGTAGIAAEHGAGLCSAPTAFRRRFRGGYGYAVEHEYELCGRDADGQHPADELRRLPEQRARGHL